MDTTEPTLEEHDRADDGATASAQGPEQRQDGPDIAATSVSAAIATHSRWLLERARDARSVFVDKGLRRLPASGVSSDWLKQVARETLEKRGPNGLSGSLGQFRGHLFEVLDVRSYNLRNAALNRRLDLRAAAHAPGYDASRFIGGRFAGGIQHKLSPAGVIKAANKLDAAKAGSARRATLRVPRNQGAATVCKVAGRMRVEASTVSSGMVKRQGNAGLRQLSSRGSAAVSAVNQFGRGTGIAAMTGVAFGAVTDAAKVYRRQMGVQEFAARRGVDAAEQATTHLASVAATAGVMVGAQAVAVGGTGAVAAAAATVAGSAVVAPAAIGIAAAAIAGLALGPIRGRAHRWAQQRAESANQGSLAPEPRETEAGVDGAQRDAKPGGLPPVGLAPYSGG